MRGRRRPVLKIRKKDGKVVARFQSIKDAADILSVRQPQMYQYCNEKYTPRGEYVYRFEDEYEGYAFFKSNRPVIVYNISSHESMWFSSTREAATALFYSVCSIERAIERKRLFGGKFCAFWQTDTNTWKEFQCLVGKN